ncbi:MAG: hypothetical protein PHH68_08045 [Candidatus Omnitrophica bacterium]|nr:hypothetical protein [Candidatus Omnitrophota bacterium]MDD5078708.1 hypothetical protein [Candidatus Omnitrophota bacterium]MDD5080249.1 hypothetical protein [Candidatus Omnitrophota bacterium]
MEKIRLNIADTIIEMRSSFSQTEFRRKSDKDKFQRRYSNFFCRKNGTVDIQIEVDVVKELPPFAAKNEVFRVIHPYDQSQNWRLARIKTGYRYESLVKGRSLAAYINKEFDKVKVYIPARAEWGFRWHITDLIYDFLQVLLINYFAVRKNGIFTHAAGMRDIDGKGLVFAGESGCGKSTTVRIWNRYSRAMLLNDDRVIIRKKDGGFFIYGSPWHGAFSDYLESKMERALLSRIFFIHHSRVNTARRVGFEQAFSLLYPAIFPVFWDPRILGNIISFCCELAKNTECVLMGFAKDKRIIDFVRRIEEHLQDEKTE